MRIKRHFINNTHNYKRTSMSAGAAKEMREKIQQKITQKLQQCSEYQLYLISKDTTI